MNNLASSVPRILRHITYKSGNDRQNLAFVLQCVCIMDVDPADDPLFGRHVFVYLIKGRTIQLVIELKSVTVMKP